MKLGAQCKISNLQWATDRLAKHCVLQNLPCTEMHFLPVDVIHN